MPDKYYAEIFKHSGTSYHKAMQRFPAARDEEFKAALSLLDLTHGSRLLDVPAGGGYLRSYLPESIDYIGLDFSSGFATLGEIDQCSETNTAFNDDSIDNAVCIAALHHVENKPGFFQELNRCLRPGGQLLIGDVVANSPEADFLNGFVNDWNSLGHNGTFISLRHDTQILQEAGFSSHTTIKRYHWNFDSQTDCHHYLRLLFALDKNPTEAQLDAAISQLGTKKTTSGFHLNWSLGFISATSLE